MSTSQRTFEQVKNILGKLDRDIDAARAKRLQTRTPAPSHPLPHHAAAPVGVGGTGGASAAPSLIPARPLATPTSTSGFGRAMPMRLDQRTQIRP